MLKLIAKLIFGLLRLIFKTPKALILENFQVRQASVQALHGIQNPQVAYP